MGLRLGSFLLGRLIELRLMALWDLEPGALARSGEVDLRMLDR